MMKITITGSSGFVGQNLIKYLYDKEINSFSLRYQKNQEIYLEESEAIIHLAGKAHDLKKTSEPNEYYEVNFGLTKKMYDAFIKSDAKKFILISSIKVVADSASDILTEETIPNPQTHYGKSKLMAEQYIQTQPLPEGKYYYILRPCMIHGPGNKGNLNLLFKFIKKGIPYPLAAFENKRSFLSVDNLCFVINSLIEKDVPSGVYQVADDESLSTNDLVREIALAQNYPLKLWAIPKSLIKILGRVGDVLRLPLNSERLDKLTENYIVSNTKIKVAIGEELPVSAKDGLRKTIKSF